MPRATAPSRHRPVLRLLLLVPVVVVVAYAAILLLAWRYQESVVYQPPTPAGESEPDVRRVSYAAADGAPLFAYVIGDPASARRTVLAFHGNADLARWEVPWGQELARRADVAVVLAEYRGYSGLGGKPAYAGLALDAAAALKAAHELGAAPGQIVYYGHSLGSAVASELATASRPEVLVLESPFTSARAMAGRMAIPGIALFWPMVARVRYATADRVAKLDVPVWVAHGDRDLIVPVFMGRAVFAAAHRKGQMLIVAGAGHNDLASVGRDHYWSWLVRAVGD